MCSPRRFVRLMLPLAAVAVLALFVRSRRSVEVWHVAADQIDGRHSINIRGLSSVGRALPLQGRCQEFESPRLHNFESLCATPYPCRGRQQGWTGTIACIPPTPTSQLWKHVGTPLTRYMNPTCDIGLFLVCMLLLLLLLLKSLLGLIGPVLDLVDDLPGRITLPRALLIGALRSGALLIWALRATALRVGVGHRRPGQQQRRSHNERPRHTGFLEHDPYPRGGPMESNMHLKSCGGQPYFVGSGTPAHPVPSDLGN